MGFVNGPLFCGLGILQRAQYSTSWELTISHILHKLSTFHGIKWWNSYLHKILILEDILNEWREEPSSSVARQLSTLTKGWPCHLTVQKPRAAGVSRPVEVTTIQWLSQLNESCSALVSWEPFGCPDWGFYVISSVVKQMPGYIIQSRGTAHTPLSGMAASPLCLPIVAYLQLASVPVWAQNPDSQPSKAHPPVTKFSALKHQSLVRSVKAFSLP